MRAFRFIVTGKVQGVFFRSSTREQALQLGLRGLARNLADGRVEVVAAGEPDAIKRLEAWLQQGPPLARVERVERSDADPGVVGDGFTIT